MVCLLRFTIGYIAYNRADGYGIHRESGYTHQLPLILAMSTYLLLQTVDHTMQSMKAEQDAASAIKCLCLWVTITKLPFD